MFRDLGIWILAMGILELLLTIQMEFITITALGRMAKGKLDSPTSSIATGERFQLMMPEEIIMEVEMMIAPDMVRLGDQE